MASLETIADNLAVVGDAEISGDLIAGSLTGSLDASNIGSGTIGTARLGSGSASSSTFLRGDQTWAAASTSPGGSNTYVQFNDSGSFGGDAGLVYNKTTNALTISSGSLSVSGTSNTFIIDGASATALTIKDNTDTTRATISAAGAIVGTSINVGSGTITGSGSGLTNTSVPDAALSSNIPLKNASNSFSASQTIAGGTVTTSKPILDMSQTWNDGAVTFTGFKFNTTQTASASASLIFDWQQNGTSVCKLGRSGALTISQAIACSGLACADTNSFKVDSIANGGGACGSTFLLSWTSSNYGGTKDSGFARNAAGQMRVTDGSTGYGGIKCGTGASTVHFETNATGIGFYGATPAAKPTITGSRGANAALADLLTKLATLGIITDSTS